MAHHNNDTIRLRDLVRGVVGTLPDFVTLQRGLFNMAMLKPQALTSIGLHLQEMARRHPDNPALSFAGRTRTYAELNAWANRIAHVLRARGIGAGDSVGVLMENRAEVIACVAGIVKLGAVAAMLNHNQRGEVLEYSIRLTKAQMLLVGDECLETLRSTSFTPDTDASLHYFWEGKGLVPDGFLDLRAEVLNASASNPPETATIPAKRAAFYIFTSGTTGMPKASVMSHYRWLKGMNGLGQSTLRLNGDDVFYCPLPLYHNNALTVSWGAAMSAGATLALGRKFSASRFWDEIREVNATGFCYIGEICRYLLNQPPRPHDRDHQVRVICGNGLRPEIWDAFQQRFGIKRIAEFYGASESNVAFVNSFGLTRTAGFCPLPFAVVEFDAEAEQPVRGEDGFMRKVARGGVGLLITEVSEKFPFDGYTDAQASQKKLFEDVFKGGDCWFNSGDLVRDQGFRHIAFVDRVGDTYRWKGENVATTEVEGALNRHPQVEQAVVYGVEVPGCEGRAGMASLTWKGRAFNGKALAQFLSDELPGYAVPLFIRLRPEQELTGTFKFRKVELKQQGFDPARVSEPLYALVDAKKGYERITPGLFARLAGRTVKL